MHSNRPTAPAGPSLTTEPVGTRGLESRFIGTASPSSAPDLGRSGTRPYRVMASGLIGLTALVALAWVGGDARMRLHLPLPGPVIGLALLALLWLLAQRFHTRSHQQLSLHLTPVGRLLVGHLGLLFVPAGVGIITMGEALRKEWLPLIAGVVGSTVLGLVATGWLMHRFAPKGPTSGS